MLGGAGNRTQDHSLLVDRCDKNVDRCGKQKLTPKDEFASALPLSYSPSDHPQTEDGEEKKRREELTRGETASYTRRGLSRARDEPSWMTLDGDVDMASFLGLCPLPASLLRRYAEVVSPQTHKPPDTQPPRPSFACVPTPKSEPNPPRPEDTATVCKTHATTPPPNSPPWSEPRIFHARPPPPPPASILARHAILLVLVDPADGDAAVLRDEADELLRDVLGVVVLAQGVDVRVDDLLGGLAARLLAAWMRDAWEVISLAWEL